MELKAASAAQTGTDAAQPLVSVLLAVRNESAYIEGCIEALAAQDYPHDRMEVILLDGESGDDTVAKATAAAARYGLALRLENNQKRTAAAGFNLGLALARGDVIVKVDGHSRPAPDFISAGVRELLQSGADAVGGRIRTLGQGRTGEAIALAMSSPFGVGDAAFRHRGAAPAAVWTDSVPFGAYRRSAFERAGLMAEDIVNGEDDEFNYRLLDKGGRILLSPLVRSDYFARTSLAALWRQYWGYGLAKVAVLRRHPRRLRPRHLVPSAFLLCLALGWLPGLLDRRLLALPATAATAYLVANLTASARLARSGHRRALPLLPLAFACIHLAAGAGMLAGLAREVLRAVRRPAAGAPWHET